MGSLPENTQTSAIIARAKGILMDPVAEWAKIATETDAPKQVFLRYVLPMAAIGPIASLIGMQLFGVSILGMTIKYGLVEALVASIMSYIMALVGVWVIAYVANFLSPKFGGKDDLPSAFRMVAYSLTAGWVAGVINLLPSLSIIALLAAIYGIYIFYKGTAPVMAVPVDKGAVYTIVTIVVAIVVMAVLAAVATAVATPFAPAATSATGAMTMDFGENGSIVTDADGNMVITGPDGEEVRVSTEAPSE